MFRFVGFALIFLPIFAADVAAKKPKTKLSVPAVKVRVFVGESEAFFASGFGGASANGRSAGAAHSSSAGVEKMTVLVMKTLHDNCPGVIVVDRPDSADYFLRLDRNGTLIRSNALAAFNRAGEMMFVGAGVSLTKQVKGFCGEIPSLKVP